MPRHYRLTARSLPVKRPSRISEAASAYPLTAAGLLIFACLNAFLWTLAFETQSPALATFAGNLSPSTMASGVSAEQGEARESANVVAPFAPPTEVAQDASVAADDAAAAMGTVASRELPEAALAEPEAMDGRETELAEEVEQRSAPRYVLGGTWAPNRAACDKQVAARTGWLPMKISDAALKQARQRARFVSSSAVALNGLPSPSALAREDTGHQRSVCKLRQARSLGAVSEACAVLRACCACPCPCCPISRCVESHAPYDKVVEDAGSSRTVPSRIPSARPP